MNHADALALVDGCPTACGNTEPPRSAVEASNGWLCGYLCRDCGEAWTTSWKD